MLREDKPGVVFLVGLASRPGEVSMARWERLGAVLRREESSPAAPAAEHVEFRPQTGVRARQQNWSVNESKQTPSDLCASRKQVRIHQF